jgi:hypothetical protein
MRLEWSVRDRSLNCPIYPHQIAAIRRIQREIAVFG